MTDLRRLAPLVLLLCAACAAKARVAERSTPTADEIWIVARSDAPGTGVPRPPRMR